LDLEKWKAGLDNAIILMHLKIQCFRATIPIMGRLSQQGCQRIPLAMRCHSPGSTLDFPTPGQVAGLESLLQRRLRAFVANFQLSASDAGLVLQGSTRSYYDKQRAQETVMSATDLPIAVNEIKVL
jgi:hypothetical protein